MLTRCSCRHPLSDHQTWPIAAALLSRTYYTRPSAARHASSVKFKMKSRRNAIISARPRERHIDRSSREGFTDALHDMLKQRKGMHGLTDREDSYISVRELLNYQHFRMLSFPNLQKVVNEDRLHRFELLYQPLKGSDADSWWIRVKQNEEKDIRLDPIIFGDNVGAAVYGTTLQEWRSYISLKGISRKNDDYIRISRGVPVQDYFTTPLTAQVLIHIDVKHAIDMGIRFFLSSRPSPFSAPPMPSLQHSLQPHSPTPVTSGRETSSLTSHSKSFRTTRLGRQIRPPPPTKSPSATTYKYKSTQILTPGNEFGFLPPEYFTRVEVVRVKRKVLWTPDEEAREALEREQSDKNEGGAMLDSDTGSGRRCTVVNSRVGRGRRTERAEVIEKRLDQFFINLPTDHQAGTVHPDLREEALAILSA